MTPQIFHPHGRITVRACHTDRFKAGRLTLSLVLPARQTAYMTTLLLSVLLRGTVTYPSVEALNRRLDYLFGTGLSVRNNYRGDCHVIDLSLDVLNGEYVDAAEPLLPDLCELLAQILFSPVTGADGLFDAHYLASEKQLQCDTVKAQRSNPSARAKRGLQELMYGDEPCAIPAYGTEEEIMAVTAEELYAHWRTLLEEASLEFFYVGSAAPEDVVRAVRDAFATRLDEREGHVLPSPFGKEYKARKMCLGEETLPVKQGRLMIGLRAEGARITDGSFEACALFNELLGASPVSKLFMNVREKMSLCYSCSSVYNSYKGAVVIGCGLENANRERAEREILRQVREIAEGHFTDMEWEGAKKSLSNAYRQVKDSPDALINFYFGRMLAGVNADLEESLARISQVTRKDVMRVAASFAPDAVFYLRADPTRLDGGEDLDEED